MAKPTYLVTGASGHLGRRAVELLLDTNAGSIIATTRDPGKLAACARLGVDVRKADFDDPASLAAAFAGASRLLLVSTDALDRPGARQRQHKAAIDAAVKAGVSHIVYTSMPKPEPGSPIPFAPDHYASEQALAASGLKWTVLRNSWYMENLFYALPHALASGKWYTAAGEGKTAHVSREDCAAAAVAALTSGSTANIRYDITGPEARTTVEIAKLVSEVSGRPIEVVQVTEDQLAQGMLSAGVPAFMVPIFVAFDVNTRAGNLALVTDAVKQLTGRAPQILRDFLIAHRAALAPAA